MSLVLTNSYYTYRVLERDIRDLKQRFPFIQVGIAGKSVLGKNLYYLRLGTGNNRVFYQASHHANEWITTPNLMLFIENFAHAYSSRGSLRGYSTVDIWNRSSIYAIPMVNPDGVDLVIQGLSAAGSRQQQVQRLLRPGQSIPPVWKANIRGVDLNLNYPAGWSREIDFEHSIGVYGPAPADYGGPSPLSEPETRAVADFTRQHGFRLTISFHSQGRVIYWQYLNHRPPGAYDIAQRFARISGYAISAVPPADSYAGYKDWFIQEYNRPGYTIEVGRGRNPLPITQLPAIYRDTEGIMVLGAGL
jgi:g-D-glutamyl-meso-diaminopimelate peptidase